ncbi:MAG: phytanoyl-CoA dioxygenase family protein [Gammaproteobacteria bacterium]|nr:phytanoyl-CoA dioxygenase family protein [Gammaproteobacteria bacterium]
MLSNQQIDQFKCNGVLLINNFYDYEKDILPIHKYIYKLIGLVIKNHNLDIKQEPFSKLNFDSGYQDLINTNRECGAVIYDAIKQIPAFIRLLAHPAHEALFRDLFPTGMPGIAGSGFGMRIDNPQEERFRADWHQEYLSQLRSLNGIVLWSPLLKITEEIGPVEVCIGSQKEGVLQVTSKDSEKKGAYALKLVNESNIIQKYKTCAPVSSPGDVIILDWHVVHRSGENISNRSRWSMQMRYFDFMETSGIKLNWQGSFATNKNFKKIHPEHFID